MATPTLAQRLRTSARQVRLKADLRRADQRRQAARRRAREQRGKPAIASGLSPAFEEQLAEQTAHIVEVVKRREAVLAVKNHASLVAARHRTLNPQFGGDGAWRERIEGEPIPAPVRPAKASESSGGTRDTPENQSRSQTPPSARKTGSRKAPA